MLRFDKTTYLSFLFKFILKDGVTVCEGQMFYYSQNS